MYLLASCETLWVLCGSLLFKISTRLTLLLGYKIQKVSGTCVYVAWYVDLIKERWYRTTFFYYLHCQQGTLHDFKNNVTLAKQHLVEKLELQFWGPG